MERGRGDIRLTEFDDETVVKQTKQNERKREREENEQERKAMRERKKEEDYSTRLKIWCGTRRPIKQSIPI